MKRGRQSKASRELAAISSNFLQVRILYYASRAPTAAAVIAERLRQHGVPSDPAPILARMTRSGLLRAQVASGNQAQPNRQYAVTLKGRRLLDTARKHLHLLAAPQFTNEHRTRTS